MNKKLNIVIFVVSILIGFYFLNGIGREETKTFPKSRHKSTTIDSVPLTIDFGRIKYDTIVYRNITLKNTGDRPLVVENIDTGCGCIKTEYNRVATLPDSTLTINMTIKPNKTGYFSRTVWLHCNVEQSPLLFTVKGRID